ncbi:Manganese transport system membrane protein MntB [Cognatishimia activa]|uniref:Manganese transport system membrane protein MntB n=1 Tax=Cognatishimia activa TaxID=1715691 RepID=A0A0P1IUS4_9RHOB|nr:metal ABC transporter permease [Cognatishimia activa]CUK27220.1 Manganese transport system membrane protein MntB [Cognatishimia activa]
MSYILGVVLLACTTALTCALPGVFVVLRKHSMIVDGISHAVLPGIIIGFAIVGDLDSPVLILGAAVTGLLVVLGNEWLTETGLLAGDAPQGLIFPSLFAVGILMVSMDFQHVHLDTHVALVGDMNLAAVIPLTVGGVNIGPEYLYVMLGLLLLNAGFIAVFYRALKITTFDRQFAEILGIRTRLLNTAFMFLVSVTVVAAFNAVGAILVISLLVVPAATAQLISTRLSVMFALTAAIAIIGALAGFWIAYVLDTGTSAAMAVFYGVLFVAVAVAERTATRLRRNRHQDVKSEETSATLVRSASVR